ncbi:GNAT family N-acetyltransferase [Candidatus Bathyarchaeota archaeon]|nr:GNAT family N-acetyltransferase [Candidatus Bathyarchaeota archaeon]
MKWYVLKNGKTLTVREADERDAKAITHIIDSVAAERIYLDIDRSREDWDEAIREVRKREGITIIAETNGKAVGMAHLVKGKYEKNRHVAFLGMSVAKKYRGRGFGTAMMNYLLEWTEKQRGLEKISLSTFSTNLPAMKLYRKFGFKIEGRSRRQYKICGKYVDEITMGKFLS